MICEGGVWCGMEVEGECGWGCVKEECLEWNENSGFYEWDMKEILVINMYGVYDVYAPIMMKKYYDECMKDIFENKHYEKHLKISLKNEYINNLYNLQITPQK